MLRSAIVAVRSTVLQPENFRQLNSAQIFRLIGTQLRLCSAQSSPDTKSNPSKDAETADQKTSEADTKASDSEEQEKESQHDRLLKEKESLIKDLQVCHNLVRLFLILII